MVFFLTKANKKRNKKIANFFKNYLQSYFINVIIDKQQSLGPLLRRQCGCSSMVELQPSKLTTWVRFPSPAPLLEQLRWQSNRLLTDRSQVRVLLQAPWPVGETVNSHAFHACIHGFESRTGHHYGGLAQLGEHLPYKQRVSGSSPLTSTIFVISRLSSIGRATDL